MDGYKESSVLAPLSGTMRAFTSTPGALPSGLINNFPFTQNGCSSHAMRTKWRTVGTVLVVGTIFYKNQDETVTEASLKDSGSGTSGWIDTNGCAQPVFFVRTGQQSTLADVAFEVRQYELAP
jgi:hypothetical protein